MLARPDHSFVAFDLETTGLSAESDRVVEIGAVRFDRDGRELGRFERLVNPGMLMRPSARAVHGISDAMLADAPSFQDVAPSLLDFLGDPDVTLMLAHNARFDAAFLGGELARIGRTPPGHRVVDTLTLARRKLPHLRGHRLDVLARAMGLDPDGPHRALADSLRVKGLWLALGGPREPIESLRAYPIHDAREKATVPIGWDAIARAILEGSRVRMRYLGGTRGDDAREITPRDFSHRGGVAYLVALCHLDEVEKRFRLDCVKSYEVVRSAP